MINKIQYTSYSRPKTAPSALKIKNNSVKLITANLNNSPLNINNRISFGIDDAGKRPVKGVKNVKITDRDFSEEIASARVFIERKKSYPTSTLQDRMDDEAKGFEGYSVPIEFYPDDLKKLEEIKDIDEKIEFLADLRKNKRYKLVNKEDNKKIK